PHAAIGVWSQPTTVWLPTIRFEIGTFRFHPFNRSVSLETNVTSMPIVIVAERNKFSFQMVAVQKSDRSKHSRRMVPFCCDSRYVAFVQKTSNWNCSHGLDRNITDRGVLRQNAI